MLFALVEPSGQLAVTIALRNAPAGSAGVLDLPAQHLKPLFPTHVRRNFPMRRIMRRNGDLWGALGRTTCADAEPQTLKNPVSDWVLLMEPRRLELLTPCMPCSRFGGADHLRLLGSALFVTKYVRRSVRRFVLVDL